MKAGETFHARAPSSTKMHLYIAVTDSDADGYLVIANVTSQEQWKDQSCVLGIGDHPYIRKGSVINYAEALVANENLINEGIRKRYMQADVPVSPQALAKVQAGALASPHTEAKVKNAVKAALGQ